MSLTKLFVLTLLVVLAEVTQSSHNMVKRSDDADPYAAVVSTHSQELTRLDSRVTELENISAKLAAFRATLQTDAPANAPVPFTLEYGIGSGSYDSHLGVYTVAIPGVYSFAFQMFAPDLASYIIDLFLNGNIYIRSRCYDSAAYTTSCYSSSFLHLRQGDTVWVQVDHAGAYYNGVHTFFTGALISPDP